MRCKCNPCRAEFGDWRGVRRCAICGKVFHTGWKCRPQCETIVIEDCPGEDPQATREECPAAEAEECQPGCGSENKEDHCRPACDEQVPEPFPHEAETHQEEPTYLSEWAEVFPHECFEESGEATGQQLWPLDELTDQLPPDQH